MSEYARYELFNANHARDYKTVTYRDANGCEHVMDMSRLATRDYAEIRKKLKAAEPLLFEYGKYQIGDVVLGGKTCGVVVKECDESGIVDIVTEYDTLVHYSVRDILLIAPADEVLGQFERAIISKTGGS